MEPVEETSDERIPCDSDTCTGILDARGACGTCGRRGDRAPRGPAIGEDAPEGVDGDDAADEPEAAANLPAEAVAKAPDETPSGPDDGERVPCPVDTCIGIIGTDGRCGTCGRDG